MATNGPKGKGREGAVKDRSQLENPKTQLWQKRTEETGRFIDDKTSDRKKFKGIRKEK
jgi:hypothetical protein